ncbi:hypothetical protein NKI88_12175 [Mesorhizobium sp. M0317]|uniref:hypothetical protein n=1 Tax=Mesorhizobium sp. M0317 TaxID=2956935 RepID=UPI00333B1FF9
MASSEGDVAPEAAFAFSPGGFATWLRGIDFRSATFSTGQAILLKNTDNIAAMTVGGVNVAPLLFLDSTDNTWVAAGGKSKAVFFGNSDFEKQLAILSTDNAVNNFEFSGAVAGQSPLLWMKGSDTDVGSSFGTKGVGVHSFYTAPASPNRLKSAMSLRRQASFRSREQRRPGIRSSSRAARKPIPASSCRAKARAV